jgi:hypothetical protein
MEAKKAGLPIAGSCNEQPRARQATERHSAYGLRHRYACALPANRFTGCQRAILEKLTWIWPQTMTRQELADATSYSESSGDFNSALAALRALELINKGKDIKASEVFFE